MSITVLRRLNDIITSALDSIDAQFSASSLTFPSLDDPYNPAHPVEVLLGEPEIVKATSLIIAAASQLIASVRHPARTLLDETLAIYVAPCMRATIEGNVVEIVRDAGPKGIHVTEIAKLNGADSEKTARILRLLANRYIFTEISPDVFAINRTSSLMDTGKTLYDLQKNPSRKHEETTGLPAFICGGADEYMRFAGSIPDMYTHPVLARSTSPEHTPFNLAFDTSEHFYEWYRRPENVNRFARFGLAMAGVSKMAPADAIMKGFDWSSLPEASIVVDVGGGIGSCSLSIAERVPHLKFIIQDKAGVISNGPQFWAKHLPNAIGHGRVEFKVQDFFEPQPSTLEASVYLLRHIIHDWPDDYAKKILRRLREAARPTTKLIVVDIIIPYTSRTARDVSIPEVLLPSLGPVSNMKYFLDAVVYSTCNGEERTAAHFVDLAKECGWKVLLVYDIPGSMTGQYVAVPA